MKKIAPILLNVLIVSAPILLLLVFLGDAFELFEGADRGKTLFSPLCDAWAFWVVAACLNLVLAIFRRIRKKARPSFAFYYGSLLNLAVASFVFLPRLWVLGFRFISVFFKALIS